MDMGCWYLAYNFAQGSYLPRHLRVRASVTEISHQDLCEPNMDLGPEWKA